jgi:hypothetical protein
MVIGIVAISLLMQKNYDYTLSRIHAAKASIGAIVF